MKRVMFLMLVAIFTCCTPAFAEVTDEELAEQVEDLKAAYNDDMAALEEQFTNGEITKQEFADSLLAANNTLTTQVAALRSLLSTSEE